jgi:hypothetical protein
MIGKILDTWYEYSDRLVEAWNVLVHGETTREFIMGLSLRNATDTLVAQAQKHKQDLAGMLKCEECPFAEPNQRTTRH